MIVYQMLPRLWGNACDHPVPGGSLRENGCGKFSAVDDVTLGYLRDDLKVTHVWYTGVIRHATTESFEGCPSVNPQIVKGRAGSPYAIVDYYDVNPYLADNPLKRMDEFESLLKRTHDAGMKVLIDFVPNHVSRAYGKSGLCSDVPPLGASDDCTIHWRPDNDFFYYPGQALSLPVPGNYYENPAKASGNCFSPAPGVDDWYETIRLNYCDFHTPTWDRMLDIVRYWCGKGVDGFRCDMVEMVPWQFFKWLTARIKAEFPGTCFIGEVYEKENYPLYLNEAGFDYLYDKSGLYDSLRAIVENRGSSRCITWNWQSLGDMQPRMLNFLENHDEQRFASDYFGGDASRTFAVLAVSLYFNEAPFMIYCGEEVGERAMDAEGFSGRDGRTTIFDWWSVPSLRRLYDYVHSGKGLSGNEADILSEFRRTLHLADSHRALVGGKTFDLCYCNMASPGFDPDRHFAFLRGDGSETVLFVCNFSPDPANVRISVPDEAISCLHIKKTETFSLNVSVPSDSFTAVVLPV